MPPSGAAQMLLFPRFGYTTAAWEPLLRGSRFERVGEVSISPTEVFAGGEPGYSEENFADVPGLRLTYWEEAELLVRNAGSHRCGFAVCTRCGFADSEEKSSQSGQMNLPNRFERHSSVFSTNAERFCWPGSAKGTSVLRNRVLAARERTDMALLQWPADASEAGLYSLGRALVLGGTRLLEIDGRELGVDLKPVSAGKKGVLIYDTTPGGAGHCWELTQRGVPWLTEAEKILKGSSEHQRRCERACIECILDFAGQFRAAQLDRRSALEILQSGRS
jgi:hypothetical protein